MGAKPKTEIRAAREGVGLTRRAFADKIGASVYFVARLESGAPVAVDPKLALRIARVLNFSAKQLFSVTDEEIFTWGGSS